MTNHPTRAEGGADRAHKGRKASELQECVCGDYRWQHKDNAGPCMTCLASSAPWDICYAFETEKTPERIRVIEKVAGLP